MLGRILNFDGSIQLQREILRLHHSRRKQPKCESLTELYDNIRRYHLIHFDSDPSAHGADIALAVRVIGKAQSLAAAFHFPVTIRYVISILHS